MSKNSSGKNNFPSLAKSFATPTLSISKGESSVKCSISSSKNDNLGGTTFSSDRINCNYNISSKTSVGGYISSDSHYGGPTKGGSGYGVGINLGFKFK